MWLYKKTIIIAGNFPTGMPTILDSALKVMNVIFKTTEATEITEY
jgi:hypothetical protein